MKKLLSLILTVLILLSFTSCGSNMPKYEKVDVKTALHTSPELSIKDKYYYQVLEKNPYNLLDWLFMKGDMGKYVFDGDTENYFEQFGDNPYEKASEISGIPVESYFAIYNVDDYTKLYKDPYYSDSISDRIAWAEQNQFRFATDYDAYNYSLIRDSWDFFPVYYNWLSLETTTSYIKDTYMNPYLSTFMSEENIIEAELTGPYDYFQAVKNLDVELEKMRTTVKNYLEQKYMKVDNGVEFSDYLLNYTTYNNVKAFMKVQDMNVSEIKDINIYANPLTFHPFVDVEYALVVEGEEYKLHEIYFLEIDKTEKEFIYKIAYVADYGRGGKYNYTRFRMTSKLGVNESFEGKRVDNPWYEMESENDYKNNGLSAWYFVPEHMRYYDGAFASSNDFDPRYDWLGK